MEVIRDLRANGAIVLARAVIVALFFLSTFCFATFAQATSSAVDQSFSERSDVDLYNLIDAFTADPAAFSRFRESRSDVERLVQFSEELDAEPGLERLSVFDQPVSIRGFRGAEEFDAGYGGEMGVQGEYRDEKGRKATDVKAVQLNESAFDFYGLRVADGTAIDWQRVDYTSDDVPVVLGADYRGLYSVGDTLPGNLYFRDLQLRVVGFLAEGTSLFYQGDINHYIDDAIVVPYPTQVQDVIRDDLYVGGILAFAMFNSDVAVDKSTSTDDVLNVLERISDRTGFRDYSLTNLPTYAVQYSLVKRIVHDNFALLLGVIVLLGLSTLAVCAAAAAVVARRRMTVAQAYWNAGWSLREARRLLLPGSVVEAAVTVGLFVLGTRLVPSQNGDVVVGIALGLTAWLVADVLLQGAAPCSFVSARSRKKMTWP